MGTWRTGHPDRTERHVDWLFVISASGVASLAMQLITGWQMGLFPIPGGDTLLWDRVGDAIRAGSNDIYALQPFAENTFVYAPPWAILFATVSWFPAWLLHVGLVVAKVGALRVIGGSWRGAGIVCWFPLVAFDLASGAFNLVIAAAIVAAIDRRPALAVLTAFAKFSPALALDRRDWRRAAAVGLVCVVVTLPVLELWPAWISRLISMYGQPLGYQIGIPFLVRLTAAVVLLALDRPVTRALAAAIAIPAFYVASLVILVAPLAILIRGRSNALRRPQLVARLVKATDGPTDDRPIEPENGGGRPV